MTVIISNLIDLSSTAVCGLWFKHDIFSDFCASFNPPCQMEYIDLKTAVTNEWVVRMAMTDKRLRSMKKAREAYEDKMEEKQKENEKSNKTTKAKSPAKKTEDKKKTVKNKSSRVQFKEELEPPVVDESTYIDIEDEYLQYEAHLIEKKRESFSPDSLGLPKNEVKIFEEKFVDFYLTIFKVNLREHHITNGVFKIECFERPSQTKEINFQLFLRLSEFGKSISFV